MINRRTFTFGLGSVLLGAAAHAEAPPALTAPSDAKAAPDTGAAPPVGNQPLPREFAIDPKVLEKAEKAKQKKKPNLADIDVTQIPNHRQMMRDIIAELASYAKKAKPNFVVLVRNAPELLIRERREWVLESLRSPEAADAGKLLPEGALVRAFMRTIDGLVIDGAYVGLESYGKPTDPDLSAPLLAAAAAFKREGRPVLALDYANAKDQIADIRDKTKKAGFLSYVASGGSKILEHMPKGAPVQENTDAITNLNKARNWVDLQHPGTYTTHADWINAVRDNNYDVIATDVFWRNNDAMTIQEAKTLQQKTAGTRRLVLADMSIGKAFDTRFYWKSNWDLGNPGFLVERDEQDPSAMLVEYWNDDWKKILGQYIQGIMAYGLDGVILSDVDTYGYFEEQMPLE